MPEIDNNNGRQLIQQASNTSIGGLFTQVVKQNPNSIAIISGTQEVSFHELNLRVNTLANELINKGIKLGDRVALISKNCAECIELELACAKIGGILVSLNWRLTSPEIEHCINLTNPKIIFGLEDFVLTLSQKTKVEYVSFGPQYEKLFTNTVPSVIPLIVESEAGLVIIFTSGTFTFLINRFNKIFKLRIFMSN